VPSVIVSLSGIHAETLDEAVALAAQCDRRGVPLSLLVAPRLRNEYRLSEDPVTLQWLHSRKAGGDVIVLHGYDRAAIKRRRAEFATWLSTRQRCGSPPPTASWNTSGCGPGCSPRHDG